MKETGRKNTRRALALYQKLLDLEGFSRLPEGALFVSSGSDFLQGLVSFRVGCLTLFTRWICGSWSLVEMLVFLQLAVSESHAMH